MLFSRPLSQVGIEIESHEIRAVKVRRSTGVWQIENQAIILLKKDQQQLTQALIELRERLSYQNEKAVISIDYRKTFNKSIHLNPTLPDKERQQQLQKQLQLLFGLAAEAVYYDYYYPKMNHTACHIIAAKKSDVQYIMTACKTARIKLGALDVNALACTRLIDFLSIRASIVAFILFQRDHIRLCVVERHQLIYTIRIDSTKLDSDIHRALQFYYQSNSQRKIEKLFFLDIEKTKAAELPKFKRTLVKNDNLDPRLYLSFSLATWGRTP